MKRRIALDCVPFDNEEDSNAHQQLLGRLEITKTLVSKEGPAGYSIYGFEGEEENLREFCLISHDLDIEEFNELADPLPDARPRVNLIGTDGNAFSILGKTKRALREAGWDKQKIDEFIEKATAGDYDHLLATVQEYCDVY